MSEDKSAPDLLDKIRKQLIVILSVALSLFTLCEVNYQLFAPLAQLATFGMLGLVICYLSFPVLKRWQDVKPLRILDMLLAVGSVGKLRSS